MDNEHTMEQGQAQSNNRRPKTPGTQEANPDERSALLPKHVDSEEGSEYDLEDGDKTKTELILHEFWVLLRGSLPVILAYTLQNSLQTVSVLIVGRSSPEALATAGTFIDQA